ncbi:MAG: MaoC family dehydratase [Eubacterium sp.]|nr:MaoC family dehydratase [Eubacterium sp.]
MTVGIRYCGGCNPRYDRAAETKRLQKALPDTEFTFDSSRVCDLWLLVCGCPTACVSDEGLRGSMIIRLSQRKDFARIREQINQKMMTDHSKKANAGKRVLTVGERASLQKSFSMEEVNMFARLSLDENPLHLDFEYAKKGIFRKPVVHGVLAAGLLSSVMGSKLPGPGTILMEENVRFLHPVYPGECICAEMVFDGYEEAGRYYIGHFSGRCTNEAGITVIEGTFRQMMRKRLFEIGNGTGGRR